MADDTSKVVRYCMFGQYSIDPDPQGEWVGHDDYATLARQLAEANSELVNLRAANIAYASEVANLYGRAGLAESQLAEATRRLGEVEEALADLVSWFPENPSPAEWRLHVEASDAITAARAALTKEPAK